MTDRGGDISRSAPTSELLQIDALFQRMTPREYHSHVVSEYIDGNLPEFYQDNSLRRDLSQKAAVRAEEVTAEFGLRPELTKKVARLALYDFVILCGRLLRLHL